MSKCRRLVLHFDVNETIMVGDPASNINFGQSLNNLLAKVAFFQDAGILVYPGSQPPFKKWWYDKPLLK